MLTPVAPSDWIALNVLRNVALSTNSVAASVEPVVQQQFFSLSPMPGQESFPDTTMAHTPTTTSMLAALQADSFAGTLDPAATTFGPDAFGPLSYLDGAASQDDLSVHASALSFHDYGSSTFEVPAFTPQDLGISASGTPPSASSEPDNEPEPVKSES